MHQKDGSYWGKPLDDLGEIKPVHCTPRTVTGIATIVVRSFAEIGQKATVPSVGEKAIDNLRIQLRSRIKKELL